MGITIHYKGKFAEGKNFDDIKEIVFKVGKPLAKELGLNFEYKKNKDRFGRVEEAIKINDDCEWFDIKDLGFVEIVNSWGETWDWAGFTKTQYAPVTCHLWVCAVLKALEKSRIFQEFDVLDEGEYYETGDLKKLTANIQQLGKLIKSIGNLLFQIGYKVFGSGTGLNENGLKGEK